MFILHSTKNASAAACLFILFSSVVFAQETSGSISGTVKDTSGASIANATVIVTETQQGTSRTLATTNDGNFAADPLQPGKYQLSVESPGFKKAVRTDIVLFANQRVSLGDIPLEVGTQSETISVEASAEQLQTEDAMRSGVITGSQTVNLALNGRNYLDLVKTVPGVNSDFDGEVAGPGGIGSIYANGQRGNENNSTLDGIGNMDTGSNGTQHTSLNIDAVAELSVVTNAESAEFGRSVGASINVVVKSGTSDFHGTGYWFHRNDSLNANSFFNNLNGESRQLYRYNYQGFNIGGPIYIPGHFNRNKNKLFFFFAQEWQDQLEPLSRQNVTVPTALQRMGDFQGTQNGSGVPVTIIDPTTKLPFPNNTIPASLIDPNGTKILDFYPLPNFTGDNSYNYTTQDSASYPRRQQVYRVDWNISDNWKFFARAIQDHDIQDLPYGQWNASYNIPFTDIAFGQPGYSTVANLTEVIDPTMTNEIVFGLSHNFLSEVPTSDAFSLTKLGTTFPLPYPKASPIDLIPNFTYSAGITNPPYTAFEGTPFMNYNTTIEVHDNFSKVVSNHRLKAGVYWQYSAKDQTSTSPASGTIDFGTNPQNPGDTGYPFANVLLGNFNTFQQSSTVLNGQYRYNNVEFYGLDSWKVTPKLTVEYGMRFYWVQPQYDQALQTSTFNPGLFSTSGEAVLYGQNAAGLAVNPLTGATAPAAFIGAIVPGTGTTTNGIYTNGIARAGVNYPAGLINSRGLQYAPRLGIAYNVLPKTVIRLGGGVFYDRFQGNPVFQMLTNPPGINTPTIYYGNIETAAATPGLNFPASLSGFDKAGQIPTTYNYNLSIQREFAGGILLDVGYVGSVSNHLLYSTNINGNLFGSANLPQNQINGQTINQNLYRPYPGFADIQEFSFGANSNYNALQVSANRRLAHNFQVGLAYTWSKAMGVATGDGDELNPINYKLANYGPLGFDRTQILVVNYIYNVPAVGRNGNVFDNPIGHIVLNHWVLSGITTWETGEPFTASYNTPANGANINLGTTGSPSFGPRLVEVGNLYGPNSSIYNYLNPAAFFPAQPGSEGFESGENNLRLPSFWNFDLSVFKDIPLPREGMKFELRLEAFNVFNHPEFNGVNSAVTFSSLAPNATITNLPTALGGGGGVSGFGALNSTRQPRIVQIAAKFYF
ncbi:TonB-dependent receptor [Nevskia soli]|jgi:hypothetical protein|uniref:TonB-dependent receptor n=1 Tax=Nevskia soli TaxID=418856 RepID=UPI0015D7FB63|nr:carboxypeptidase regulatory-like domain-containing protein [Nevskia soli]